MSNYLCSASGLLSLDANISSQWLELAFYQANQQKDGKHLCNGHHKYHTIPAVMTGQQASKQGADSCTQ